MRIRFAWFHTCVVNIFVSRLRFGSEDWSFWIGLGGIVHPLDAAGSTASLVSPMFTIEYRPCPGSTRDQHHPRFLLSLLATLVSLQPNRISRLVELTRGYYSPEDEGTNSILMPQNSPQTRQLLRCHRKYYVALGEFLYQEGDGWDRFSTSLAERFRNSLSTLSDWAYPFPRFDAKLVGTRSSNSAILRFTKSDDVRDHTERTTFFNSGLASITRM